MNTEAPPTLLVLDGQGVVFTASFDAFLEDLGLATAQLPVDMHQRWREVRDPCWRGRLDEAALWRALGAADVHDVHARMAKTFRPGPAAANLARWSAQVPVWLLTNHRTEWIEARLAQFRMGHAFARILVSDALGALKPERAAFAPALASRTDPREILFVDDQAKNVTAAIDLGMRAILADPADDWVGLVDRTLTLGPRQALTSRDGSP